MFNHHRRNWIFNTKTKMYEKTSKVPCYKLFIGDYDSEGWMSVQKRKYGK